ncbi:adenylate/guanylate cyclase domain-containing protein [Sphingomonas sp. BIUV-7]|uniref:Adenylate/guanylate cyclase domain-containing protein n=1 Tax=Sphingomonas natans TaxID=3063330 RepID=A0ABT8YCX3_9SPHN|nr:adenylate/guanylate cyclase domain-containing protein [Sphingomonas sp. BIUV-7]MDO6415529.1 adenylate/guanylate cyclase domain-containing protein [Sphingomonas sp. BIUV-7]
MATEALPAPEPIEVPAAKAIARMVRRIGARQLIGTILVMSVALLFARYSWSLPLGVDAEHALYDVRLLMTSQRIPQDPRIVMVVYTDETLEATARRSPLDRGLLAKALTNLDKLGAKAIGIDILIDEPQPEDDQLVAAFRGMKTPVHLAFAGNATNGVFVQPWQEDFMRKFQASLKPGNVWPTSIRVEADPDGVMRSWPTRPPGLPPLLSNAMAKHDKRFEDYHGSLLYRLPQRADRPVFSKLPIDLFALPEAAEMLRSQIQGRYVLMGGDISDVDQFDTPATRLSKEGESGTTTGLEIHATMLAQQLDNRIPRRILPTALWGAALLVVVAAAMAGFTELSAARNAVVIVGSLALLIATPLILQRAGFDTQRLPMFGWLGGWVLAFIASSAAGRAVSSDERRFAQSALGKYLPPDVAKQILRDPDKLALHGEQREIFAMFTDLEGFTQLSSQIAPAMVAQLLNRYLDLLSDVVLEHGGTLDKFVGDAVIAFWGAPISRPDDADRAVKASMAMYAAGERFRREAPAGVPPIGRTRVGLHMGVAIVGNFGGEGRIQYTALGDSMNAASRLESANKKLHTTLLVSGDVVARSTLKCFRPMGRITVRGRSETPMAIYEALPDCDLEQAAALTDILARFDAGDASAISSLETLISQNPKDLALVNLLERLQRLGPGGSYALD